MTNEEAKEYLSKIVKDGRYPETGSHISLKTAEVLHAAISAMSVPEREEGEWIAQYHRGDNYNVYKCSCCDYPKEYCIIGHKDNFCPNCGADMRGSKE